MNRITNRVLVSLDGECPYHCRHCYTYELPHSTVRSIPEIVDSIEKEEFDVIYVSQKIENFADPDIGIKLCEELFDAYHCHLMIITRNVLPEDQFGRLIRLNNKMKQYKKKLFLASSVIGMKSAERSEELAVIPDTIERLNFVKRAYCAGIPAMVLIRPLFPKSVVPNTEIEEIIDYIQGEVSCVLTGPLMVNEHIIKRLELNEDDLTYTEGESEYLSGAISGAIKFVDVSQEMEHLKNYCKKRNVPYFQHSMPALNYLLELEKHKN